MGILANNKGPGFNFRRDYTLSKGLATSDFRVGSVRYVLLGPPHDVEGEGVDGRGELLLRLDQRDLLPRVQVLDHHAGQDLLSQSRVTWSNTIGVNSGQTRKYILDIHEMIHFWDNFFL